jgi:sigma-B regulation protein RsbU (phosphoserine phosphatase)
MDKDEPNLLPRLSYHSVLDQLEEGVFVTDRDMRIVYWNEAAERISGFPAESMLHTRCSDTIRVVDPAAPELSFWGGESCPLRKAIESGLAGTYPRTLFMQNGAGRLVPVSVTVAPVHDEAGAIAGGVCLFAGREEEFRQRRLAGEIQKRMVTRGQFRHGTLEVATLFEPMEEIGGDFVEAFCLHEGPLVATVADATGHGVSAALFSMIYKALLHAALAEHRSPGSVLRAVNQGFLETVSVDGFYLTACLLSLDPRSGAGRYAAGGAPPGLLFAPAGRGYRLKETIRTKSLMLGASDATEFDELAVELQAGELLLLASDGLFEAPCLDSDAFGSESVERFFAAYDGSEPLEDLFADLSEKSRDVGLRDDVSLLLVRRS